MPFDTRPNPFVGAPPAEADDGESEGKDNGEGLPTPKLLKLKVRRAAGLAEARAVLDHLPGPCESLHAVCTARMDVTDVISRILEKRGVCLSLRMATLGYNPKNLAQILSWHDQGAAAETFLLTSIFFRANKPPLWKQTQEQFATRKMRCAAGHSHCKVVTMAFSDGTKYAIEGSANLCGNGSGREQFCLINDVGIHDWHSAWIEDMVRRAGG